MVGGGIYIALGVVIAVAAQWAWLSFLIAGVIAACSAYSYAWLANHFGEGGGAFAFLEDVERESLAGGLAWMLLIGYTLTISVYAYAFGHYMAYAFHSGPWIIRALAIGIVAALVGLNLMGVSKITRVEIVIVTGNLAVLILLAAVGLFHWEPAQLIAGIEPRGIWGALIGAAAIFVSYEGFQLLTYEYDELKKPEEYLTPVLLTAVICVIAIYVLVALGATMIAGALTIVEEKQIALSVAAEQVAGPWGLVVMTIAAGFATSAAINSTLFSTAKLAKRVADDGELPVWFEKTNSAGIPARAVILIGALAAVLAVIGSLSTLVEAASLAFLIAFSTVNWLAVRESGSRHWIPALGLAVGAVVGVTLVLRLAISAPLALGFMAVLFVIAGFGRPTLLNAVKTDDG